MTEAEAKTKWCPQTRLTGTPSDDLYTNRDDMLGAHERHARCLASACMAWRESDPKDDLRVGGFRQGFCGLAGAPQ